MNSSATPLSSDAPAISAKVRAPSLQAWARLRVLIQVFILALVLAPRWWPFVFASPSIYQGNYAASQLRLGGWLVPMADPWTALSVWAGAGVLGGTFLIGALLIFVFYLLVRARAFCAYACPVHLVLEWWDRLVFKLGLRREPIGRDWPKWTNAAFAGMLLAASAAVGMPVFEPVNPINTLIRAFQHLAFGGLGLVGAVMLLELVAGRRAFCRHLCPVGGVYAAANQVGVAGVAVDPDTCTGCRRCTQFCLAAPELEAAIVRSQSKSLRALVTVDSPHCTMCLDCASHCAHQGIVFQNRWARSKNGKAPHA